VVLVLASWSLIYFQAAAKYGDTMKYLSDTLFHIKPEAVVVLIFYARRASDVRAYLQAIFNSADRNMLACASLIFASAFILIMALPAREQII